MLHNDLYNVFFHLYLKLVFVDFFVHNDDLIYLSTSRTWSDLLCNILRFDTFFPRKEVDLQRPPCALFNLVFPTPQIVLCWWLFVVCSCALRSQVENCFQDMKFFVCIWWMEFVGESKEANFFLFRWFASQVW